ncbi:hypothetical protein XaC1_253 [Xanthomonas phage XaC1]|nr:hypothetical protein XaC1_253 [Xanthomonas phage XaC1]
MKKMVRDSLFSAALMVRTSYDINPVQTCLLVIVSTIFLGSIIGIFLG